MTLNPAAETSPFHLVDTIVKREAPNSPWITVEFVGEGGETVSVRMPFSVARRDEAGRISMVGRAVILMNKVVEASGQPQIAVPTTGRFGIPNPKI